MSVILPIESYHREIDFKLLLGAILVEEDSPVILSQHNLVNEISKLLKPSVYIGKNMYRNHISGWINESINLRKNGHILVHLDEEGAFYWGDESEWDRRLKLRMNLKEVKEEDFILTWGDYQKNFYEKYTDSQNVIATGHPRFCFHIEKYQEIYKKRVQEIEEDYGNFILITTSYDLSNSAFGHERVFSKENYFDFSSSDSVKNFGKWWLHTSKMCSEFVNLILNLSQELPEGINIVIRPHPSESSELYEAAFRNFKNINIVSNDSIVPWILASKFLISEGCTTIFEAKRLGKDVLIFNPLDNPEMEMFLPGIMGQKIKEASEVIKFIGESQSEKYCLNNIRKNPRAAKMLSNLYNIDSFELISDIIKNIQTKSRNNSYRYFVKSPFRLHSYIFLREIALYIRKFLRIFNKMKQKEYLGYQKTFSKFDRKELIRKLEIISSVLGKEITIKFVGKEFAYLLLKKEE